MQTSRDKPETRTQLAMNYTEAKAIADDLVAQVAPYCQRVEIAGSIRRGKAEDIKDVELVVIPHLVPYLDMFQNPTGETFNMLFEDWARHNPVRWIKPGASVDRGFSRREIGLERKPFALAHGFRSTPLFLRASSPDQMIPSDRDLL